jgi:hypothetical protein
VIIHGRSINRPSVRKICYGKPKVGRSRIFSSKYPREPDLEREGRRQQSRLLTASVVNAFVFNFLHACTRTAAFGGFVPSSRPAAQVIRYVRDQRRVRGI